MDQPDLDEARHLHALRGLERINFWSGSAGILWSAVRNLARQERLSSLRLLDIATGAGDVPIRLWHKARRAGLHLEIEACDLSPRAVAFARTRADQSKAAVQFFIWNALEEPDRGQAKYDVVSSSLFLHHLTEEQAVTLLTRMGTLANRLVLVNDLRRCVPGYLLAWVGSRLLTTSRVVHHDGPASVAAAFRPDEVLALAQRVGLAGARVSRRWPCRWLLQWRRAGELHRHA
jgi:2-polyprenyl-3-methyl-5-hydroxy-6-metoxy-1,4-benzoquinol methylase